MRYVNAFFKALAMTLRGERIPATEAERRYPRLLKWLNGARPLLQRAQQAAAALPKDQQQALTVRVDGRDTRLDVILGGVAHHLQTEYPHLLDDLTEHSITGIYALNLNDVYALQQLETHPDLPASMKESIKALHEFLAAIPPSNELDNI